MYNFSSIIGHTNVIKSLQNSIANDRVSHAYIINSEDEMSRSMISNTFAKTLMCLKEGVEPCNECASCRGYEHGNSVDVIQIDKEDKSSIGIETIRTKLVSDIEIRPYQSRYKIYMIKEADTMTEAAQNAILKTIEEPHQYAIILLESSNYKNFLTTILSRCRLIELKPITNKEMHEHIVNNTNIKKENVDMYLAYAQGNLSKFDEMTNKEEFIEFRNEIIRMTKLFLKLDIENMVEIKNFLSKNEKKYREAMDLLYLWYRDIAVVKEDVDHSYVINKDMIEELKLQAKEVTYNFINKVTDSIQYIKENIETNMNLKLATHVMLMRIKE